MSILSHHPLCSILPQDLNKGDDHERLADLNDPGVHEHSAIQEEIQEESQEEIQEESQVINMKKSSVAEELPGPKNLKDNNECHKGSSPIPDDVYKTSKRIRKFLDEAKRYGLWRVKYGSTFKKMKDNLEKKNEEGNTVLSVLAASKGMLDVAEFLVENNKNLLSIPDSKGKIPVQLACRGGYLDVARFLYRETPLHLLDPDKGGCGLYLLQDCIEKKAFDIAHDLLHNFPSLALLQDNDCSDPTDPKIMTMLAQFSKSPFSSQLGLWRNLVYDHLTVEPNLIKPKGDTPEADQQRNDRCIYTTIEKIHRAIWMVLQCIVELSGQLIVFLIRLCFRGLKFLLPSSLVQVLWTYIFVPMQFVILFPMQMVLGILWRCPMFLTFLFMKFPGLLVKWVLKILGIKQAYDLKLYHAYANKILSLICEQLKELDQNQLVQSGAVDATFLAIKNGIPEIVIEFTKASRNILWSSAWNPEDRSRNDMFAWAVIHRQKNAVQFLYENDDEISLKMLNFRDEEENNILHVAAKLAPDAQLGLISGAALQLQSEIKWFKSVEGISPRFFNDYKNKNGETPSQVFAREHKSLQKDAEEWIKKTAESATVVGALIITMMFAAVFTVPGGNNQDGLPMFSHHILFKVFIISDAISLFAASSSVLLFFGILTSRYSWEDFLTSLPMKLIFGISSLFISIATMMLAFCAALFIMLHGQLQMLIPIVILACVPVIFFGFMQFPLFIEIYTSTLNRDVFHGKVSLVRWLIDYTASLLLKKSYSNLLYQSTCYVRQQIFHDNINWISR